VRDFGHGVGRRRRRRLRGRLGRGGGRCGLAGRAVDVGLDDPSRPGPEPVRPAEVDAALLGEAAGERARLDPVAGIGPFGRRRASTVRTGGGGGGAAASRAGWPAPVSPPSFATGSLATACFAAGAAAAAPILALAGDQGDDRPDLHLVGAFGDQDPGDRAFVDRLELHRRLVGLDLGEQVAGRHAVAFLDQPLGERALPPWSG
jgi:hypothetical protein